MSSFLHTGSNFPSVCQAALFDVAFPLIFIAYLKWFVSLHAFHRKREPFFFFGNRRVEHLMRENSSVSHPVLMELDC